MKRKITSVLTFLLIANTMISQPGTPWVTAGNNAFPAAGWVNPTNNFIGTNATNPTWLRMGVQGQQDIFIDNNPSQLNGAQPLPGARPQGGHWVGLGRVFTPSTGPGANATYSPKAHLHIHAGNTTSFSAFSAGIRNWFNTGTLYSEESDAMYVGLRILGSNSTMAVINWSDDQAGSTDFLSFNFTGQNGLDATVNGAELARINPKSGSGTFGIGNFMNIGMLTEPVRRLEILDANPQTGANANSPQLRITHTYNANPALGVFSEFQTTASGNLYFNTRTGSNAADARSFGFHKFNPLNTVEISAQVNSPYLPTGATGSSGLRFTSLTSANNTVPNGFNGVNSTKVLTVDSDGDVVLTDANAVPTTNNGISINAGVVQLGVPCTLPGGAPNSPGLVATGLTQDRAIYIANQNFWFANGNGEKGAVAVGGNPTGTSWCNIGNTFEISANSKNTKYGSIGASGLRLTKLLSTSPTIANGTHGVNSSKVLTVDQDGDVVLTDAFTGTGIGNYCSATTPNPLTGDYEIPMNIYNYYFSGQGTGRTNVGVGLPCGTNLGGKVHAYQLANNFFFGSNLGVSVAGRFDNYTSTNAFLGYGVLGNAAGPSSAWNIGVYGTAANAAVSNFAGYFDGDVYTTGGSTSGNGYLVASDKNIKTNVNTVTKNLDVISKLRPVSYDFDNSYAPQLKLNNHKNYGFIAQEVESIIPDIVSTTTVIPTFDSLNNVTNPAKVVKALNYDGLIPFAIGGIQELNAKQKEMQASLDKAGLSDAQVKTNVNSFNALAKIKTLNPVQYNFTNANVPQLTFKSNLDYGFVAQQLETVYPELVDTLRIDATYDSLGVVVNPSKVLKTVNYKAMTGLLVRSIQEQQLTIDSLRNAHSKQDSVNQAVQQQLATLASLINACCSNTTATRQSNSNINQLDIELSDKDAIVLNQNVPNPFAEQTTITYNVPASVGKAQIIFFNNIGQVIQTVDIKTRGKGKVNVFASDLSSGLYNYTLVADGKVIDSKKMVRE